MSDPTPRPAAPAVRRPPLGPIGARLALSRAKHRSIAGHARIGRRLARLLPDFSYDAREFFRTDDCNDAVAARREAGLERLALRLREKAPQSLELTAALREGLSDLAFTDRYRVPYPFRDELGRRLRVGAIQEASQGVRLRDADGQWSYDLGGAYGVNLLGYDYYKACLERAAARVRELGPVLGPYHPVVLDNVERLRAISGLDEVSFHMSGTEAVMQAVALARYHTGRSHLVRFCGAYHGWWDGVQPGVGNPRDVRDVHTLAEGSDATLRVLETRRDVACVLVNPLQALHPNQNPAGDSTLLGSRRGARYDREAYARWLARLRDVCTRRGIVLVLDEVFLGFRLAPGGVQEYFDVRADLVTYGKTLGGGLPVGVVCGRRALMKRYRETRPSDVLFARGTFNAHPYVMAAMNEFLRSLDRPEIRATWDDLDGVWDARREAANRALEAAGAPVRFANMTSVWTTLYTRPSPYNWMLQFYLRAEGLSLSWIGTGRLIFSHAYDDEAFAEVLRRIVRATEKMARDGWWWSDGRTSDGRIARRLLMRSLGRRARDR